MKITLIKDGQANNNGQSPATRTVNQPINESSVTPLVGKVTKLASVAALSKVAYNYAKKAYQKISSVENEGRVLDERLRQYGGSGWSANTVGDRFNVFGKKIDGESVAYKK